MEIFLVFILIINFNDQPLALNSYSPGDSVDWTNWDGGYGPQAQKVWYDVGDGTHLVYSRWQGGLRNPAYAIKLGGIWNKLPGVPTGQASYPSLGVKPFNDAAVICYHMQASGDIYRCWVAIDDSQGSMMFTEKPVMPQEQNEQIIWGRLAIDNQGYFHIVCHSYDAEIIYYTRSTDDGTTWSDKYSLCEEPPVNTSGGCFADRWNSPGKTIRYWTQWTGDGTGGHAQHSQDIYYQLSTDYGTSWGPKINLTNYQLSDTLRAYAHVKTIFDGNGDPHIVWPVNKFLGGQAYIQSSIMHWSPATGFSKVAGPFPFYSVDPGAWKLPSDFANITVDRDNGWLYCVWTQSFESDLSQDGYPNGEIMAKYSTDNGATWISNAVGDTGVNLTKTHTPNAAPGQCADDDYPSVHPYVEMIDGEKCLIINYLEDKDAGWFAQGEGTETANVVRVYFAPCEVIINVEENPTIKHTKQLVKVFPNPSNDLVKIHYELSKKSKVKLKISDVTGQVIKKLVNRIENAGQYTIDFKTELPAGVYFIQMETEDYQATERFVVVR